MQKILNMAIEPIPQMTMSGLSGYISVSSDRASNWRMHWTPVLGFNKDMDKPISLDPGYFRDAVAALKERFPHLNIATASGDMYLFTERTMSPNEAELIDRTIQKAYWQFIKSELPGYIAAR